MYNWVGEPLLYSSADGLLWSQVSGGPVVGSDTVAIASMLSCKGTLYVGYWNAMSSSGTLLISALGPAPAPTCQIEAAEKGVGVVTAKIVGITDPIYRIYPRLPELRVLPPIGPRPPPPNGDEWDEWTFLLVTDLIDAVDGIEVWPEAEELRELVLGDLEIVNAEVGLAMSILYEATSGVEGDVLRTFDLSDVLDEVLSHLEYALELCQEISSLLPFMRERYIDIKPGSWPNPINIRSRGKFAVVICGTEDFDIKTVNATTVKLYIAGIAQGVSPIRWSYQDAAMPYTGPSGGGQALGGDGYLDLVFFFGTQAAVVKLGLAGHAGETIPLIVKGNLYPGAGGLPIQGQDYVWILKK